MSYHESVVGPAAEFHDALLVVEREPGDVDFAGALENARRLVIATAVVAHHHVRLERVVEAFVSAAPPPKKNQSITQLVYTVHCSTINDN